MAGKAKFDQEAAFKSIVGPGRKPVSEVSEQPAQQSKARDRVQRSYFLDRDLDKALRKKALEDEKNLTETVNEVLRKELKDYL